jgi:hypothetical protein
MEMRDEALLDERKRTHRACACEMCAAPPVSRSTTTAARR